MVSLSKIQKTTSIHRYRPKVQYLGAHPAHPRGPPAHPRGPPGGPSRAQAGPKPGPSWAQAGPKPGPGQISGILEIWDLEIWEFGIQKIKILEIKIRVAQNVGKVWISKKKLLATFGAISGQFFHGPENFQNYNFCIFSLVGQWLLFNRFRGTLTTMGADMRTRPVK